MLLPGRIARNDCRHTDLPNLAAAGIHIHSHDDLSESRTAGMHGMLVIEIFPALDPAVRTAVIATILAVRLQAAVRTRIRHPDETSRRDLFAGEPGWERGTPECAIAAGRTPRGWG
jgi:hypothetical protein